MIWITKEEIMLIISKEKQNVLLLILIRLYSRTCIFRNYSSYLTKDQVVIFLILKMQQWKQKEEKLSLNQFWLLIWQLIFLAYMSSNKNVKLQLNVWNRIRRNWNIFLFKKTEKVTDKYFILYLDNNVDYYSCLWYW